MEILTVEEARVARGEVRDPGLDEALHLMGVDFRFWLVYFYENFPFHFERK